ncbi:hypothetical protein JHK82_016217 [Glycine max]|nr:hypothetical protein JHK85_016619 [Glycine max]KAG5046841.1 hypothetical protein JHK86_016247 [Glycine max]KAG5149336.1 hypothetical protein JHK82_016217 [Glycine max]
MSSSPFSTLSFRRLVVSNAMVSPCMSYAMKPLTALPSVGRRQFLFFLTATTAFTVREATSVAQDIPLFGIRKSLKKAEEEVEEIVKEGFEAADKGLILPLAAGVEMGSRRDKAPAINSTNVFAALESLKKMKD